MGVENLIRIERLNYILGGVLIVAAAVSTPQDQALGVLVGVLLTSLNFSLMRRMVDRWMRTAPERRGPQAFFMIPKMGGILGLVFLAVKFLPISAPALVIGFSVFLVSIAVETLRYWFYPPAGDSANGNAPR